VKKFYNGNEVIEFVSQIHATGNELSWFEKNDIVASAYRLPHVRVSCGNSVAQERLRLTVLSFWCRACRPCVTCERRDRTCENSILEWVVAVILPFGASYNIVRFMWKCRGDRLCLISILCGSLSDEFVVDLGVVPMRPSHD